jgi:hypothetical protein
VLDELAWVPRQPLELMPPNPHQPEHWLLRQAQRPIVAIDHTSAGWSLSTRAQRWTATVRRRQRRLGWQLEITPVGKPEPVLCYRPRTLVRGGSLSDAGDARYKLRGPHLVRGDWTLAAAGRGKLAHIKLWTTPPGKTARARALRPGLEAGASAEPRLLLLLAAASVAIVIEYQQPKSTAGGSI